MMRKDNRRPFGAGAAVAEAVMAILMVLALAGCTEAAYPPTITPIYAATTAGLAIFDGTSWRTITTADGLPSNALTSLVVMGSGSGAEAIVGTAGSGISVWKSSYRGTWTAAGDGLGSDTVNGLFLGSTLLAATAGGMSTYAMDGSSPAWTNSSAIAPVAAVFSLGSQTWVAADKLYIYNGTTQEAQSPVAPGTIVPTSTSVTAVFVDSSLDVFAGTNQGLGVIVPGGTSFTSLLPGPAAVNALAMDPSGTLYAATSNGLYIIGTSTVQTLAGTSVHCVCVDGAGTIYAGTSTGLQISRDSGASWTTELTGDNVTAVTTTAPLYSF